MKFQQIKRYKPIFAYKKDASIEFLNLKIKNYQSVKVIK